MKNLDQIRARHALNFWANTRNEGLKGDAGREVLSNLPPLVINLGFLTTMAIAKDKSQPNQRGAYEEVILEVGRFLASKDRGLLPFPVQTTDDLVRGLTGHPSTLLQLATLEALAYLGYLKRFQSQ